MNIITLSKQDHSALTSSASALVELNQQVVMQTHFVELLALQVNGELLATISVNTFDGESIYNLTDFTEKYSFVTAYCVKLEQGMTETDSQIMLALIARALESISIDLSA